MKYSLHLLKPADAYRPEAGYRKAVSILFDAANEAEVKARRKILWLTPGAKIRMQPEGGVSFGAQLWEPCEKCGTEPSYSHPTGHLCALCAQKAHPRISIAVENTTESSPS